MRTLIIQTSFLGDTVLTTPLIARVAEHALVDVVCTPSAAQLLANNPSVREVIVYDKRGQDRGAAGFLRVASRLRKQSYDTAYLAQGSARSGALAAAAGIPRRVGFSSSAGRTFYTERVPFMENAHHAARLLSLATYFADSAPPRESLRPRLYPGDAERAAVERLLSAGGALGEPLVALAPGSVWETKRWPYYAELAVRLREFRVAVIGSADDTPLAGAIVGAADGRALDATGKLSLLGAAELIGRATLLVTNDSAPLHLASAMGTPTVAIFGPTVPEFGFGPLAEASVVAGRTELACRPCDRHGPRRCPLGHWRCMREITADDVAALARDLLSSRTS